MSFDFEPRLTLPNALTCYVLRFVELTARRSIWHRERLILGSIAFAQFWRPAALLQQRPDGLDYEPVIRSGHYLAHHSGLEPETDSLEGYCSLRLS